MSGGKIADHCRSQNSEGRAESRDVSGPRKGPQCRRLAGHMRAVDLWMLRSILAIHSGHSAPFNVTWSNPPIHNHLSPHNFHFLQVSCS